MTNCAVEGCTLQMADHRYVDGDWVPHVPQLLRLMTPPPPEPEGPPGPPSAD